MKLYSRISREPWRRFAFAAVIATIGCPTSGIQHRFFEEGEFGDANQG
jgi:hypothetical protein